MKDSISRSRISSEPYSSGSGGSSTTSCASRLLRGEYGTRRADESMGTESAERHSSSLASMNDVRLASGSTTVSRMVPSPRTAETAGIRRSFRASSVLLLGSGFAILLEPFKHAERLPEAQMFDSLQEVQHVAVGATAEAMKIALPGIDRERGIMVVVEGAEAHERAPRWFQLKIFADHRFERDFTFDLFDPLPQRGVNMAVASSCRFEGLLGRSGLGL